MLARGDLAYSTGQVIMVDGGILAIAEVVGRSDRCSTGLQPRAAAEGLEPLGYMDEQGGGVVMTASPPDTLPVGVTACALRSVFSFPSSLSFR